MAGKAIQDLDYLHTRVNLTELFDGDSPKIWKELERTLDASEKYLNDSDTVIFAATTLKRILIIVQNAHKPLPDHFWNKIILHIRRVWDYTADCVCYNAIETFASLLDIHLRQCLDCLERPETDSHANCDRINEITQWLLEPTSSCKARFKCIYHLVSQCPTLRLNLGEDFFRRTYPLLSNPSFSSVICQLIVDNIFDRDELWDLHCELLLTSTDAKLIKSRLVPMLQKYHLPGSNKEKQQQQQKQQKPQESDTAVKFLNQLLIQLNSQDPPSDLQSQLEIVHALVNTTWPRKKVKDDNGMQCLVDFSNWTQCISEATMGEAIVHVESEVRLAAFKLVVENPRKTIAFNENDIEYIKTFLASNMTLQAPSARQELIAAYKYLCQRLGASAEIHLKAKPKTTDKDSDSCSPDSSSFDSRGLSKWRLGGDNNLHPIPESYICLAKWMAKLAFGSLSTKGNYYRRIMGLMQIDVLFSRENFIVDGKCFFVDKLNLESTLGSDRHNLVIDCLDDSYDMVQSTALGLLKKLDFGNIKLDEKKYLNDAVDLMTSTRSRNATSAGFRMQYYLTRQPDRYKFCLMRFLDDVNNRAEAAEKDLLTITTLPIHSILNMIELLLRNPTWKETTDQEKNQFYREEILDHLLQNCHKIIKIVAPVVQSMTPEGCIPDEILSKLCGVSADRLTEISQHLLICCWRAHKHVSGIFAWIIEMLAPLGIVTNAEIEAIGSFYWAQLTECKHRGAFESATDGFFQLCSFLWSTTIQGLPKPADWLEEILSAIRGETDLTNLCSTRRSAGLPSLVLSIVATEPKENENGALIKATGSLLNMDGKTSEYRVHSMNVMKTIVQSSTLHNKAVFCFERALRVAIEACRADWSERNAASQLFAALRTKIFGVMRSAQRSLVVDAKNRKSNYEFFSKFPTLYKFLYDQLTSEQQSEFSLLPPLVVLSHLYTPASSSELYPLRPFVPKLLEIALREKRENLRAHAIAAILSISDAYAKEDLCQWIEGFDYQNSRQNHVHSFLLLMEGLGGCVDYVPRIVYVVENILKSLAFRNWSDFNINQLLLIANAYRLEYDVDDVSVELVCLTKRPLAVKLLQDRDVLKSEMCHLWRDEDTRREVYRVICKLGWNASNMFLRAHIITLAIKDLAIPHIPQCDAKRIMEILTSAIGNFMSTESLQKVEELIEARLEDPNLNWTLPSTIAYATKLRYSRRACVDQELIAWIRECYEQDDPETKQIALEVGAQFVCRIRSKRSYTDEEKELIGAVALYLQDESERIRNNTSYYLGHLIKDTGYKAINPEICRLLVIKWCLNDGNEDLSEFASSDRKHVRDEYFQRSGGDDLFDACAVNQYEEYQLFGDIQMYESSLGFSGVTAEMYDIEY